MNEKDKIITKFGNAKINNWGYYKITSCKEGNRGKHLHRLVWEDWYGKPIPIGYDIHHLNGDKKDNRIQNLQCVEHRSHMRYHNENKKGKNNSNWKPYARVNKRGSSPNGKQFYELRYNGKPIKYSINKDYLEKLADLINRYSGNNETVPLWMLKQII